MSGSLEENSAVGEDCIFVDCGDLIDGHRLPLINDIFCAVPRNGGKTVTELAREVDCDIAIASKVLSRLEENDCIKQEVVGREVINIRTVDCVVPVLTSPDSVDL